MKHLKELVVEEILFDNGQMGYEVRQELVRCRDCVHSNERDYACQHPHEWGNENIRNWCRPNWFCADGEAKDKDGQYGEGCQSASCMLRKSPL